MEDKKKKKKGNNDKKKEKKDATPTKAREVVVMDGNSMHDWVKLFEGKTLADGSTIHVTQAAWNKVNVTVYNAKGWSPPLPFFFHFIILFLNYKQYNAKNATS